MAQPPDTINETFLREVDENLRRDRARDFMRDNGKWLIAAVILFLAAAGGVIYWKHYRQEQAEKQVEQLSQIYADIGAGKTTTAPKQLDELSDSSSKGVRASAMFTRAALALQQNDTKLAMEIYGRIADDSGLPRAYRDAALVRHTAMQFDQLKPEEVITRLEPLAKAGNPWFGSAGEMTALALIKQGKKAEAGQLFAAIAKDPGVPDTLKARSVQIAGSLGVDASDAVNNQR